MDLSNRLAISYYKPVTELNAAHGVSLVQHIETGKLCVRKDLDVYNAEVFRYLAEHLIEGTPSILAMCEDEGRLTVIEEFISGRTLREVIDSGDLTADLVNRIMLDLCRIIGELHGAPIPVIHRDIKPANVIIAPYGRAVLLDFNAAKFHSPDSGSDTVLLGTQGYAAPEQYGFGSSSPQTDIYALGILLREMVSCGNPTAPGSDSAESPAENHFPSEIDSSVYAPVIERCTRMDQSDRYGSVAELADAIRALMSGHDPSGRGLRSLKQLTPPGFRTLTPWKMLLAVPSYIIMMQLGLTLQVPDATPFVLWCDRIYVCIAFLLLTAGTFDYLGIQRLIPLCSSKKPAVRILGIILLDVVLLFFSYLILFGITSPLLP